MGVVVGYARVSSTDQDLEVQLDQLRQAGCTKIFAEKKSGTTRIDRKSLEECLAYVREGDTLVVTRMDRLARSVKDFANIMASLEKQEVGFRCVNQPIDTTSSAGRLTMQILAAVAEFESAIRSERQKEGIAAARARGVYSPSTYKIAPQKWAGARRMLDGGRSFADTAEYTGISEEALRKRFPKYLRVYTGSNRPGKTAQPAEIAQPGHPSTVPETPDEAGQEPERRGFFGKFLRV